jgi:hypothetical protein
LSQARQCGEDVFRMLDGAAGERSGDGIPHRIVVSSVPLAVLRTTGAG